MATTEDLLVALTTLQVQSAIQHDHVRAELAAIKEQTTKTNGRVDKLENWRITVETTAQVEQVQRQLAEKAPMNRLLWLVPGALLAGVSAFLVKVFAP